jgi:hypothetical protein
VKSDSTGSGSIGDEKATTKNKKLKNILSGGLEASHGAWKGVDPDPHSKNTDPFYTAVCRQTSLA